MFLKKKIFYKLFFEAKNLFKKKNFPEAKNFFLKKQKLKRIWKIKFSLLVPKSLMHKCPGT